MRNRIVLLAVIIGLLVGLAGVGLLVVADDDGGTSVASLPKLPISATGERAGAAMDALMPAGPVEWRVRGDLPSLDDHATAYRRGTTTALRAQRLADALGYPELRPFGDGWRSSTGVRTLAVTSDGAWSLGPDCAPPTADTPNAVIAEKTTACSVASSSGVAVACAPNTDCPTPPPPTPAAGLPARDEARRIAVEAFARAGMGTGGHVEVSGPGDAWTVAAEPAIGGRRVFGLINTLAVGPKGAFVWGGGQLVPFIAIGDYPLVSTTKGFERLKTSGPTGVLPARGAPEPALGIASAPYDTTPVVRTITDVTLGLSPFGDYLAPVFLFETDDGAVWPVPAVVDELLVQPQPGPKPLPPDPSGPPQEVPPSPPSPGGSGSGGSAGAGQACSGSASSSSAGGEDNQPVTIEACASPSNPAVGETVTFTLKASDPDAAMDADGCQQPTATYGDESPDEMSAHCMSLCSRDSYPPEAGTVGRTFTHAYKKAGTYTATFTADSCAPKNSHGQVQLQIVVRG